MRTVSSQFSVISMNEYCSILQVSNNLILTNLYFRWVGPSVSQSDEVELYVEKWCELGVKYLGGCCGTSMETYQKMRSIVDAYNQKLEGGTDSFASR